jgi:peptidoglycan/LPS O-acetylase OafA/YrhL
LVFGAFLLSAHVGAGLNLGELLTAVLHERLFGYSIRNLWVVVFLVAALDWKPLRSLLSVPALVLVGRISYGMYIFHWPILVPVRRLFDYEPLSAMGLLVFAGYTAIVVVVSYASYRWFESRFLRRKRGYAGS